LVIQFFRIGDAPTTSRVSSVAFDALVTTRRQAIFELFPDLYWDNEDYHVFGKLEYQRFPDSFWGVGPYTVDSAEERYERERIRWRNGLLRRVYGRLYAGIYSEVMYFEGTYTDPNGTFARTDVPGEEGGFTSGIGPMLTFDSRDNAVSSRSGTLLSLTWLGFGPFVGSEMNFFKLQTEARHFFPIGEASALALRYYGEFQAGDVPFYHLAMLGGDELLRGYFMGRYRDKNMVVLETEYRFPLFWRFGATVFAGAGEVADRFAELASVPIRWAVGGGLRLTINTKERLNLRLDVGVGPHTHGVYFTAAEAF
jgi:outer membrane protein assembly factor BamA